MSVERMLRGHDLFRALRPKELDRVSSNSSVKSYAKGDSIFEVRQAGSHIFQILEGEVFLQLPGKTAELSIIISRVEKGELFGLSPLLDSPRYTATAKCTEETKVLAVEAKPLRFVLQENPAAGLHIMSKVARVYFGRYVEVNKNLQQVINQIPFVR